MDQLMALGARPERVAGVVLMESSRSRRDEAERWAENSIFLRGRV
jgi:hypothetical protein